MVAMLLVYDCSRFLEISIMTQKRAEDEVGTMTIFTDLLGWLRA